MMDNLIKIKFVRAGTMREWYDHNNKYHKEEMIDVYVDGKKLPRGMCGRIFNPIINIKKKHSKTLVLDKDSLICNAI